MARLFEYQSKRLLRQEGIPVCQGEVATSPEEAREIAARLRGPVVVKAQALITGRASQGGIKFAADPEEAAQWCRGMLGSLLGGFRVEKVLVEVKKEVVKEYFASVIVDDAHRGPVLIFSSAGGTGIEELAHASPGRVRIFPIDPREGLHEFQARNLLLEAGVPTQELTGLADILMKLYRLARQYEARSAELNPVALTDEGKFYALDARLAIDDNAVFRHPELGIEVAREFDHPPTPLERVAYQVEARDYRGTFYFTQLRSGAPGEGIWVGFHGAGGGGAMMAMDALIRAGLQAANFCDTSGNPPSSKVYRAARLILAQEGIQGYFYAGSGVASQEQYHLARGMVKAFREVGMSVPAVLRFGGNGEELAVQIVNEQAGGWPAPVEAYGREASVDWCAARLRELIAEWRSRPAAAPALSAPGGDGAAPVTAGPGGTAPAFAAEGSGTYSFATLTGRVRIEHGRCEGCAGKPCLAACPVSILALREGKPVLGIGEEEAAKGKCIECLACELECQSRGKGGLVVELPLPQATGGAAPGGATGGGDVPGGVIAGAVAPGGGKG